MTGGVSRHAGAPQTSVTPADDERGDHAEHAVEALDVGQDVAVERPHARRGRTR